MSNSPGGGCKKHKRTNLSYRTSNRMFINKVKRLVKARQSNPNDPSIEPALLALKPYWVGANKELAASGTARRAG